MTNYHTSKSNSRREKGYICKNWVTKKGLIITTKMEARRSANRKNFLYESLAVIIFISNINRCLCQGWGTFPTLKMCERGVNFNNNLLLTNGTGNSESECVCRVHRKVTSEIRFVNNDFTCSSPESWRLEFYIDGCLQSNFTCDLTQSETAYIVPSSSSANNIYIKMAKATPRVNETRNYHIRIHATAADPSTSATDIIQTDCGKALTSIPAHLCDTPPDVSRPSMSPQPSSASPSPTGLLHTQQSTLPMSESSSSTSSTAAAESSKQKSKESILDKPDILGAIIGGGVVFLIILIIVCALLTLRCRKKPRKGLDDDSQSEYSYARSLPGSVNKDVTVSQTVEKQREKELRKKEKRAERERKREEKLQREEAKNHVYNTCIEPVTYDNPAYAGTQNSMPDFIPPPPPPPEPNGHVVNQPVYAKSNKTPKEKAKKDKQKKKTKENKREIAVLQGGSVPYGYYDKVVDSEFGFMNDEMYGGGGYD